MWEKPEVLGEMCIVNLSTNMSEPQCLRPMRVARLPQVCSEEWQGLPLPLV